MTVVSELAKKSISQPVTDTENAFDSYASRLDEMQKRYSELVETIQDKKHRNSQIHQFYKELEQTNEFFTEFDPYTFASLVDHITVYKDGRLLFTFRDGTEK